VRQTASSGDNGRGKSQGRGTKRKAEIRFVERMCGVTHNVMGLFSIEPMVKGNGEPDTKRGRKRGQ